MARKGGNSNNINLLSAAVPLIQAVLALVRKKPKRAVLLLGVALVSARSAKLGTVAQVLLRVLMRALDRK
ncbi:hypothetical protein [Halogeometricum limi]|uniref:Uncharacterized protein n=1 Tax=Halogeometricum limi TaxID=555875 RepID=A0A1I6FZ41_9EURY|nr:hypothetical protein [Halogeometricum limi]SFR35107.1 hypothetical protein SAMN04488124_0566 [Halogeometricum limi]